ncbi:MAG: hypothetical protein GY715_00350 [Planctomycetes bacterium]|nr:hypothetical protein [Planctomycetota bacterium]
MNGIRRIVMAGFAAGALLFAAAPVDGCPEDVNGDGVVSFADVLEAIAEWGCVGCPADVNDDGVVNFGDILAILSAWGPC